MPVSSRARERNLWRAVEALKQAESLAQIAGAISGPADTVPPAGQEESWGADWVERAKRALQRANDLWQQGTDASKERARRIATRVKEGSRAVWEALPGTKAARSVQSLADTANTFSMATLIGGTGLTLVILYIGYKLFQKGKL
jgi:hypothetical protein